MRSRGIATLLAGVVIAAAAPRHLGSALHDSPACRSWKHEYEVACGVPLAKLGTRDDASAHDVRRRVCDGCRDIVARAAVACPGDEPGSDAAGCPRLRAAR
jgi:hypothetical protein